MKKSLAIVSLGVSLAFIISACSGQAEYEVEGDGTSADGLYDAGNEGGHGADSGDDVGNGAPVANRGSDG